MKQQPIWVVVTLHVKPSISIPYKPGCGADRVAMVVTCVYICGFWG